MELSVLYQAILAAMNVFADDESLLSVSYYDVVTPATVDGKRLVLPTRKVLGDGLGAGVIGFHPLSENVLRGESPVLKKLKVYVTSRLTQVLNELMTQFTAIAANHALHNKLTPDQKELLLAMPDADEKSIAVLDSIFDAIKDGPGRKLVAIYLKRGGKLNGEKFHRTAVVSFPITAEFENEGSQVFGVKCRKKDFAGLERLIEYILPNMDTGAYSYGSNDQDAPYFDALIRAFIKTATQLNQRVQLFSKHLDAPKALLIDLSWATPENMVWAKYRDLIPVLNGNEGVLLSSEQTEDVQLAPPMTHNARTTVIDSAGVAASEPTRVHAPAAHVQQPVQHQTSREAAPEEPRRTAKGLDWREVTDAARRRSLQPVQYAPAGFPPSVQMGPAPVNYYPAPQAPGVSYPAPPQPLPPGFGNAGAPMAPMVDVHGRPMAPVMPIAATMPQQVQVVYVDQFGRQVQPPANSGYMVPNGNMGQPMSYQQPPAPQPLQHNPHRLPYSQMTAASQGRETTAATHGAYYPQPQPQQHYQQFGQPVPIQYGR